MSSHHVVREAQEPALLILDPEYLSDPELAPLLEWSPTIIAMADTLAPLIKGGLKVDMVVATQGQLSALSSLLDSQAPVQVETIQAGESPLITAFRYLSKKKHQAVNILCSPEQLEEDLPQQLANQEHIMNIVLLDGKSRHALCRTGQFNKWLPAGEQLHIRPALAAGSISTSGFSRNLKEAVLRESCSLETIQAGPIHIEASCPVWVVESLT